MLISDFKTLEKILKPTKIYNLYYFKPIKGFSFDSRSLQKDQAFIALRGKYHDGHNFIPQAISKGVSLVVAQKDISPRPKIPFFLVEDSYEAVSRIAAYIREKKKPFVYAITGSVGKTITKEMLGFTLEQNYKVLKNHNTENNLLGVAKTIFSLQDEQILILELGTNSPGEIKTLAQISCPDIGIITFIKPVHLEGLGSLRGVLEEKTSLFSVNFQMRAVLNRGDPYLRQIASKSLKRRIYWFGKTKDCHLYARFIRRDSGNSIYLIQDKFKLILPVQFHGFIINALAAILGASLHSLPLKELIERMSAFSNFPKGRMQLAKAGGFLVLNDAYNVNPYSFKEALKE